MDSIPLDSRNRPASKQITVRHHTGMLSAITPESVSGMVRITQVKTTPLKKTNFALNFWCAHSLRRQAQLPK
jgi:hypothetical protein